ncbi:hypothetical protein NMY22_g13632 [Coprinellus aureogranulatus]|nr:hypothetical protein NMY22_g13632 [Coprinellus aureogranulatus]
MSSFASTRPRDQQTPAPTMLLAHFLRQIEGRHADTPSSRAVPLHYNVDTGALVQYSWPFDPEHRRRVLPCEMERFRRTHHFHGPCCLCAFLEGDGYTEARIGVVEAGDWDRDVSAAAIQGEYVAVCAKQRCGYVLCLDRFFALDHLRIRRHIKRAKPLPPQELTYISDVSQSFRAGTGLFQAMPNAIIRGRARRLEVTSPDARKEKDDLVKTLSEGVPESQFWTSFVQCVHCKAVMLRSGIQAFHTCKTAERIHRQYTPVSLRGRSGEVPATPFRPKVDRSIGDAPEIRHLASLCSSPAPTEIIPDSEFGEADAVQDEGDARGIDASPASPESDAGEDDAPGEDCT